MRQVVTDWAIEKKGLTARQLEKLLDVPQQHVSELLNGKISRMTADLWAKNLPAIQRRVGRVPETRL